MKIKSIQLTRLSDSEEDPLAEAAVDVELEDGRCYRAIRELADLNFSHNVNTSFDEPPESWEPIEFCGAGERRRLRCPSCNLADGAHAEGCENDPKLVP